MLRRAVLRLTNYSACCCTSLTSSRRTLSSRRTISILRRSCCEWNALTPLRAMQPQRLKAYSGCSAGRVRTCSTSSSKSLNSLNESGNSHLNRNRKANEPLTSLSCDALTVAVWSHYTLLCAANVSDRHRRQMQHTVAPQPRPRSCGRGSSRVTTLAAVSCCVFVSRPGFCSPDKQTFRNVIRESCAVRFGARVCVRACRCACVHASARASTWCACVL
jgi:hypothetical protein